MSQGSLTLPREALEGPENPQASKVFFLEALHQENSPNLHFKQSEVTWVLASCFGG